MKRKGISPLIAAVLLIAFTMAVATIFSQFVTGDLIKRLTGDTSQQAEDLSNCNQLSVQFEGNPSITTATVQQTQGSTAIGNVTVTWQFSDDSVEQNVTYLGSDTAVANGNDTKDIDVVDNSLGSGKSDFKEVTVQPEDCQGASGDEYSP